MTMTNETVLDIDLVPIAAGAARGLKQTLEVISAATQLRRTVNGSLVDLSISNFYKYKSTVSGADQLPPAFDGVFPGASVTLKCISELAYVGSGGSPARSAVSGSDRQEGVFNYYRPELTMRIVSIRTETDEYGAQVSWSIDFEEI